MVKVVREEELQEERSIFSSFTEMERRVAYYILCKILELEFLINGRVFSKNDVANLADKSKLFKNLTTDQQQIIIDLISEIIINPKEILRAKEAEKIDAWKSTRVFPISHALGGKQTITFFGRNLQLFKEVLLMLVDFRSNSNLPWLRANGNINTYLGGSGPLEPLELMMLSPFLQCRVVDINPDVKTIFQHVLQNQFVAIKELSGKNTTFTLDVPLSIQRQLLKDGGILEDQIRLEQNGVYFNTRQIKAGNHQIITSDIITDIEKLAEDPKNHGTYKFFSLCNVLNNLTKVETFTKDVCIDSMRNIYKLLSKKGLLVLATNLEFWHNLTENEDPSSYLGLTGFEPLMGTLQHTSPVSLKDGSGTLCAENFAMIVAKKNEYNYIQNFQEVLRYSDELFEKLQEKWEPFEYKAIDGAGLYENTYQAKLVQGKGSLDDMYLQRVTPFSFVKTSPDEFRWYGIEGGSYMQVIRSLSKLFVTGPMGFFVEGEGIPLC